MVVTLVWVCSFTCFPLKSHAVTQTLGLNVLYRELDPLAKLEWRALAKQGLSTTSCQRQNEGRQQGERFLL